MILEKERKILTKYNIVINADVGESFGIYKIGNDEEVMKYVTSANLACGFHAGDPTVIKKTVRLAKKYNVAVGAHPGFQDLRGFGRRKINITLEELHDDLLYQLGALEAFTRVEGIKMHHVSPHGMLDPLVSNQEEFADVFIAAIKEYNPELIIVIERKSLLYDKAKMEGIRVASVAYPDLKYDAEGNMIIEKVKKPIKPVEVAEQAISIIKDQKIVTIDGKKLNMQADVLCFHGDTPNAIEILNEVRSTIEKDGINVKTFD